MYADIIIDITHEKLDKVFQYSIPSRLEGMLEVGTEVVVPFGRGNKETHGYVIAFSEKTDYDPAKIKEITGKAEESMAIEGRLVALGGMDEGALRRNDDPGAEDCSSCKEEREDPAEAHGAPAFRRRSRKASAGCLSA